MSAAIGGFLSADRYPGDPRRPVTGHPYLYASASPVDNFDPTGFFTQANGYAVEAKLEKIYRKQYPRNRTTFGGLQFGLKPDIVDHTMKRFMEIKPLSMSGIAKGIAQITLYSAVFGRKGYHRGTWTPPSPQTIDGNLKVWFVNIQGVIFYTDLRDNLEDLLAASTYTLLRQALRKTFTVTTRIGLDAAATAVRNRILQGVMLAAKVQAEQLRVTLATASTRRF
jgi:hypothetical protein